MQRAHNSHSLQHTQRSAHTRAAISPSLPPRMPAVLCSDSHVKSLFYSLTCVMQDLWQHSLGECAASANTTLQKQMELVSLRGHPYNTPPRCLHLKGSRGRICLVHSPMGDLYVSSDPQQVRVSV